MSFISIALDDERMDTGRAKREMGNAVKSSSRL